MRANSGAKASGSMPLARNGTMLITSSGEWIVGARQGR